MENKYLGLSFQSIPKEEIPFDSSDLKDYDMLTNGYGEALIYREEIKGYIFVNNDPTRFLKHNGLTSWIKR